MGYDSDFKAPSGPPPPYDAAKPMLPPQPPRPQPAFPRALMLSKSPDNGSVFFLSPADAPPGTPPLFSAFKDPSSSPYLTFYRGPPSAHGQIGSVSSTGKRGEITLKHKGQIMTGKRHSFSGNVDLDTPLGAWTWRVDQNWALGVELSDPAGTVLATNMMPTKEMVNKGQYPKKDDPRKKLLEIKVAADPNVAELICLTFMLAKTNLKHANDKANSIGLNVFQTLAGVATV